MPNRDTLRLSMTIRVPEGTRPAEFQDRLVKHIEAAAGFEVLQFDCSRRRNHFNQDREAEKTKFIEQWLSKSSVSPNIGRDLLSSLRSGSLNRSQIISIIADAEFSARNVPQDWDVRESISVNYPPPSIIRRVQLMNMLLPVDAGMSFFQNSQNAWGAIITLPVGPFKFTRAVKIP